VWPRATCRYEIPWPNSFMWVFSLTQMLNLPIFAFPGFACLYEGVDYYTVLTAYFTGPMVLCVYIYVGYMIVLRTLRRRYIGFRPS
jgi:hypothetical protein